MWYMSKGSAWSIIIAEKIISVMIFFYRIMVPPYLFPFLNIKTCHYSVVPSFSLILFLLPIYLFILIITPLFHPSLY